MALLTPDYTYTLNGVLVRVKLLPDGTRWKDGAKARKAGYRTGDPYKNGGLLCGTGRSQGVTIHNTADLANVHDDGEQYVRATFNENMGTTRVHFYTDDTGAWQLLRAGTGMFSGDPIGKAEVGWHAGDGVVRDGGNMTTTAIEVIMGESPTHDAKAKENAARLAAGLLDIYGQGTDRLYTHTYWVAKAAGKKKADVDEQSTTMVLNKKWCPVYIFGSNSPAVALKNWKAFKTLVGGYMGGASAKPPPSTTTGSVNYLVRIMKGVAIRKGPAASNAVTGQVNKAGAYTIVKEATGPDGSRWGLLKSGAGWVDLNKNKKI